MLKPSTSNWLTNSRPSTTKLLDSFWLSIFQYEAINYFYCKSAKQVKGLTTSVCSAIYYMPYTSLYDLELRASKRCLQNGPIREAPRTGPWLSPLSAGQIVVVLRHYLYSRNMTQRLSSNPQLASKIQNDATWDDNERQFLMNYVGKPSGSVPSKGPGSNTSAHAEQNKENVPNYNPQVRMTLLTQNCRSDR